MQNKMLTKHSTKSRIEARPIHVLLMGNAGRGLVGRDDEKHNATSQG